MKIAFPVLYDTKLSLSKADGTVTVLEEKKGLFDYDKCMFRVPKGLLQIMPDKYPKEWEIVNMTGYYN
jgi:hypothetical protein